MSETIIATGLEFPEGPVCERDGTVYFVEIGGGRIRKIAPDGTLSVVAQQGGGPNGLAKGPDGALYVTNNGGFNWHNGMPIGPAPITKLAGSNASTKTATSNASTLPVMANH